MSVEYYEYTRRDRDVYIAKTARILTAMTRAALSLAGVSASVLPVGNRESSPAIDAVRTAAERLYAQSDDEDLHPDERMLDARLDIENYGGGVIAVEFGGEGADPVAQRESFLNLTVEQLQGTDGRSGNDRDELAYDIARARSEIEIVNRASLVRSEW